MKLDHRTIARFWLKATRDEDDCWIWTGATTAAGYGQADHRLGHNGLAHRIAYELVCGTIPAGLQIDHLCRTRPCVNPDHMELVTVATNVLRGESLPAQKARATECPRGHLLSGANLYVSPQGKRGCRLCRKRYQREYGRHRRRQASGPAPIGESQKRDMA